MRIMMLCSVLSQKSKNINRKVEIMRRKKKNGNKSFL